MVKRKFKLFKIALLVTTFLLVACSGNNNVNPKTLPIDDTETINVDEKYAQEVIDLIDALNENSTKEEVEYVISRYNDLTAREKTFVTNYQKLEIISNSLNINELIESIDIDNFTVDEFLEVKKEYKTFVEKYGEEGEIKIKQDNQEKIANLELTVVNILINSCSGVGVETNRELTRFNLLREYIDDFYDDLSSDKKAQVVGYDDYLVKRNKAGERSGILYNDSFLLNGRSFKESFDNDLGMMHHIEFSKGPNTVEVDFSVQGKDWSSYDACGFFIGFNRAVSNITALIPDNDWGRWITSSPTLVDESTFTYYYEINLETITSPFKTGTNKHSYLQVYFGNSEVNSITISNLVYLNRDLSKINELINNANSVDTSTDVGLTQFILLSSKIEASIKESDKSKLVGYEEYLANKDDVDLKAGVVHKDRFTTYYDSNYPLFNKSDSANYGYSYSFNYTAAVNKIQFFADGGSGKDWSVYNKISLFVELDAPIKDKVMFVIDNDESKKDECSPIKIGDDGYKYYLEFNLNTNKAFTGNPYIIINCDGSTNNVLITEWVGVK